MQKRLALWATDAAWIAAVVALPLLAAPWAALALTASALLPAALHRTAPRPASGPVAAGLWAGALRRDAPARVL